MDPAQFNRARDIIGGFDQAVTQLQIATEGERAVCLLRELLASSNRPDIDEQVIHNAADTLAVSGEEDQAQSLRDVARDLSRRVKPDGWLTTNLISPCKQPSVFLRATPGEAEALSVLKDQTLLGKPVYTVRAFRFVG